MAIDKLSNLPFRGVRPIPVIPTEYTDALSYGEQLGIIGEKCDEAVDKVNEVVDDNNEFKADLTEQQGTFETNITNQQNTYETNMTNWKNGVDSDLSNWKETTQSDIGIWENGVVSDLNTWKTSTKTEYQTQIDTIEGYYDDFVDNYPINYGISDKLGTNALLGISQHRFSEEILSNNLYDLHTQTPATISPHYFYNGQPYSTTQFDDSYNCTNYIEVEDSTTYTMCCIKPDGTKYKPWGNVSVAQRIFMYDAEYNWIGNVYSQFTTDYTFTTTSAIGTCKYIRFNYPVNDGMSLDVLNATCIMVKGSVEPTKYVPCYQSLAEKRFFEEKTSNFWCRIASNNWLLVEGEYDTNNDYTWIITQRGGNNLLDFGSVSLCDSYAGKNIINGINRNRVGLLANASDWIAPIKIRAVNNIDGDNVNSHYFTGGNHQYNNTGSGSTATARTTDLVFKIDKKTVGNGDYNGSLLEISWTDYIQAYNTTKADGTGREVIKIYRKITFDGKDWTLEQELVALEDVVIETFYGYQWGKTGDFPMLRFIGATQKEQINAETEVDSSKKKCGNKWCTGAISSDTYGNSFKVMIDNVDVGYPYAYDGDSRIFTSNHKVYCYMVENLDLDENDRIYLKHTINIYKQ